jgi:hypothetical protein
MMRRLAALLLLISPAALAQTPPPVPEIPFESIPNPLKLPPNMYFGEVAGVAVNSHGHVFAFTRGQTRGPAYGAAAAELLEFAPDGQFIREIGQGLYAWSFAHAVRVDRADNIWVTDKGSDMVIKFDPDGHVLMVFGRKQEASDEGTEPLRHPNPPLPPVDGMFRQVTDIAWDSDGNGYISDGYINSRVGKVSPDGVWLGSFGTPGSGPGQLNTPHNIAVDAHNNIYVADRGNRRIQVFDTSGKFLRQITIDVPYDPNTVAVLGNKPPQTLPPGANQVMVAGAPWTVCITPPTAGGQQVLYTSDAYPGRIYKISLDGKILGVLGGGGRTLKHFGWIHEIACPSENELYVAELLNWRVQKLELHPGE